MGSGSTWGMIVGAVVGAAIVVLSSGTAAPGVIAWLGTYGGALMYGVAIGGAIGGLAGGLISPSDFSGPDVAGPQISEFKIMGVSEGSGIPKVYGHQNRIAGQLLAVGNLVEEQHRSQNPVASGKSFLAGTLVLMADGTAKAIEEIKPGDLVKTGKVSRFFRSHTDPKIRNSRVTKTHEGKTDSVFHISGVSNGGSPAFHFSCTPEHEVYGYKGNGVKVEGRPHWFQARGVKRGDALFTVKGWVRVSEVFRQAWSVSKEDGIQTYNLSVAKDHNFFAGGALVHNDSSDGGGGSGTTTWYTYSSDVVAGICEGPIRKLDKIYCNGKSRWKAVKITTVQVGVEGVTKLTVSLSASPDFFVSPGTHYDGTYYAQGQWFFKYKTKIVATGGSNPFAEYLTGKKIDVAGFANSGNNRTGEVIRKGSDADNNTSDDYLQMNCEGTSVFSGAHNHQSDPDQYTHTFTPWVAEDETTDASVATASETHTTAFANSVEVYIGDDGTSTLSLPDVDHNHNTAASAISETITGSGDCPAFRGIAYIAISGLELADFGNQMPQLHFVLDARFREPNANTGNSHISEVIDCILIRAGRTKKNGIGGAYAVGDHFNTDALANDGVRGYATFGARPTTSSLSNLILRYDVLTSEESGVLKFVNRGSESTATIPETDLAAYTDPETKDVPSKFGITDQPNLSLPDEVNITYLDPNDAYQQASQKARKSILGIPRVEKIELPMSLLASEAQEVANRVLYQSWSQRNMCSFTLPPSYVNISENDMLTVPCDGQTYKVRVMEINRGADFLHEIKGLIAESSSLVYEGEGDDGDPVSDDPYVPPLMTMMAIDAPALHSEGVTQSGHYLVSCTEIIDIEFQSATLYRSLIEGGAFEEISPYPFEAMIVDIANPEILDRNPIVGAWDSETQLRVTVRGPLSTNAPVGGSLQQTLEGNNMIWADGELIAYSTVVAVGPSAPRDYILSWLLRGRRSTVDKITQHRGTKATVNITVTNPTKIATGDEVRIKDIDGNWRVYIASALGSNFANATFGVVTGGSGIATTATNLAKCIQYATGANGYHFDAEIDSTNSGIVIVSQRYVGADGNQDVSIYAPDGDPGITAPSAFTGGVNVAGQGAVLTYSNSLGVSNSDHSHEHLNKQIFYKSVGKGDELSDAETFSEIAGGRRVQPFIVGNLRGHKDGVSDDWVLEWARTDRAFFSVFGTSAAPLTDNDEIYLVRIIDPLTGSTVRTIGQDNSGDFNTISNILPTQKDSSGFQTAWPKCVYKAADQVTDSWNTKSELWVEVLQLGSSVWYGPYVRTVISDELDYSF